MELSNIRFDSVTGLGSVLDVIHHFTGVDRAETLMLIWNLLKSVRRDLMGDMVDVRFSGDEHTSPAAEPFTLVEIAWLIHSVPREVCEAFGVGREILHEIQQRQSYQETGAQELAAARHQIKSLQIQQRIDQAYIEDITTANIWLRTEHDKMRARVRNREPTNSS